MDAKSASTQTSTKDIGMNTELTSTQIEQWTPSGRDHVVGMMTAARPSETYWKMYTEERRPALGKTLQANLDRYQEIARLKEENRKLRQSLQEIKLYAETVGEVLAEEEGPEGTT